MVNAIRLYAVTSLSGSGQSRPRPRFEVNKTFFHCLSLNPCKPRQLAESQARSRAEVPAQT